MPAPNLLCAGWAKTKLDIVQAALFSYPSIILKISIDISITFTVTFNNIIAIISFLYFVIDIELKERHCQFCQNGSIEMQCFLVWWWCNGLENMLLHLHLQVTIRFARVITFLASKGFLASVRKSVIPQTAWIPARKVALIACKGFFSRMLPHVFL